METPYIRMFSFFIPAGETPETYRDEVFERLQKFVDYAKQENVILLHENEKEIYGDNAKRCLEIMKEFYGEHFKAYLILLILFSVTRIQKRLLNY